MSIEEWIMKNSRLIGIPFCILNSQVSIIHYSFALSGFFRRSFRWPMGSSYLPRKLPVSWNYHERIFETQETLAMGFAPP
jgi:hypothetical protein